MTTPFKMKYNTSPLRSELNSPLKQAYGVFFGGENLDLDAPRETTTPEKTYFTVPCTGENCPTPGLDDPQPTVPGHQLSQFGHYEDVLEAHTKVKEKRQKDIDVKGTDHVERAVEMVNIFNETNQTTQEFPKSVWEGMTQSKKDFHLGKAIEIAEINIKDKATKYYYNKQGKRVIDERSKLKQLLFPRRKFKGESKPIDPVDVETQYGNIT
jgi:hypothetical protein